MAIFTFKRTVQFPDNWVFPNRNVYTVSIIIFRVTDHTQSGWSVTHKRRTHFYGARMPLESVDYREDQTTQVGLGL
jgi:hypothetical protein